MGFIANFLAFLAAITFVDVFVTSKYLLTINILDSESSEDPGRMSIADLEGVKNLMEVREILYINS